MRYPLDNWEKFKRGYRFLHKTFYSKAHLGLDLMTPIGTPIYAPENGFAEEKVGKEIGNAVYFKGSKLIRFMHLSKYVKTGYVNEGDLLGYTGNTGLSTGPHLHIDISKGNLNIYDPKTFIDPETYFMPKLIQIKILSCKDIDWQPVKDWLHAKEVPFYLTAERYDGEVQWKNYTSTGMHVDEDWFDLNVAPLGEKNDILVLVTDKWQATDPSFTEGTTLGYANSNQRLGQYRIYVQSDDGREPRSTLPSPGFKPREIGSVLHELCHVFYNGAHMVDKTHELDYGGHGEELLKGLVFNSIPRFTLEGAKRLFKKIDGKIQEKIVNDSTAKLFASGYNYWLTKFGWSETIPK